MPRRIDVSLGTGHLTPILTGYVVLVFCVAVAIDLIVHHIRDILHGAVSHKFSLGAIRPASTSSDTLSR